MTTSSEVSHSPAPDGAQSFATRAASSCWEHVSLSPSSHEAVWVWFKPPQFESGLVFKVPLEAWAPHAAWSSITLRRLLESVAISPAAVSTWYVYGAPYDGRLAALPVIDQPIPPPPPGLEADIAINIETPVVKLERQVPVEATLDIAPGSSSTPDLVWLFETMESDWNAVVKTERQMVLVRKQLSAMMTRLNTLNRDLGPDERMHGDRQDKSDWQDARRWLREAATRLSRCIKLHDMGDTSVAGKLDLFKQIYEYHVLPRVAFDNMGQTQREFEAYRKRCVSLLNTMMSAHAEAAQEGERRATTILARIAAKVRSGQHKRQQPTQRRGAPGS